MNIIEKRIITGLIGSLEKKVDNGPEQILNLFNSGIIIDLKKLKLKTLKTIVIGIKETKTRKRWF